MIFVFTSASVDSDFKSRFRRRLLCLIKESGREVDRHDPLVNPFEYDTNSYEIEKADDAEALAVFYFDYLQHNIFNDLFDELEDDLYEMTAAHHG